MSLASDFFSLWNQVTPAEMLIGMDISLCLQHISSRGLHCSGRGDEQGYEAMQMADVAALEQVPLKTQHSAISLETEEKIRVLVEGNPY